MPCDSSKKEDIIKLVEFTVKNFKQIDILVPNMAISTHMGSILEVPEQSMQKMM